MFSQHDYLSERLNDNFAMEFFIKPFYNYHFFKSEVDGVGAVYEVLGKRTGKDTKVGQFFTPENIVEFMVRLADLDETDVVLDPACGTARFLTHAMKYMVDNVKGKDKKTRQQKIRKERLIGSDDDMNVAKLAKMNMYINKDGKTNIYDHDGLSLYNIEINKNGEEKTISYDNKIDVILTNPPLGDLSYQKINYDDEFKLKRMEIIPKRNLTKEQLDDYTKKFEYLKDKISKLNETDKKEKDTKRLDYYEDKIAECKGLIANGHEENIVTGNQMKGGALFINASKHYLKSKRSPDDKPEWRGGKLLIILDEGILNTDNYKNLRNYVKKYFYIKAVISLTKDAFVPVSKTSTKTSILYAIIKESHEDIQQEPIFFAHAEKVGVDTKGKICKNHLFNKGNDILSKYWNFKEDIMNSYKGNYFDKSKFVSKKFKGGEIHSH
jgi:type I restriction-modification system DNA methylase subunit